MSIEVFQIDKAAPNPRLEISFGQANWGSYQAFLYDSNGKNPKLISEGVNTDEIPDEAVIGNASELNGCILYWRLRTARFDNSPGGQFAMKIVISQEGNDPKVSEYLGEFSGLVQDAIGIIKLVVS